ncbi:hypothetical protein WJX72_007266 [[Myrmecia] bisecta]|uniref:Uncharacterized protein n=1 Tax=[Myrmecia] bisecta TaxID=41462 RepID=A0AAW1P940_9CHLO
MPTLAGRPFLQPLGSQPSRGRLAASLKVFQEAGPNADTQGAGSPPHQPPNRPTAQDPKPVGPQFGAYVLAWTRDWYGTLSKLVVGVCAVAAAVEKTFFKTTQAATKQNVLSWTGESRGITKDDLSSAFAEATSVQKGEARLVLMSDLGGLEQRLNKRLDGLEHGQGQLQIGMLCLFGITLWAAFRKK